MVKDIRLAESFSRELTTLLESQPVQPAPPDLPVLASDASVLSLQERLIAPADAWATCCQNAAGWTADFQGLINQAKNLRKEVLEVFRQNCEDWLTTEVCPAPPSSVWTNLSMLRPDIGELRNHLIEERKQAARDLEGGIDHEERQKLLADLKQVMGQAHLRLWPDKWPGQVNDIKQRYQAMTEQLAVVGAAVDELSGVVDRLCSQHEMFGNARLDERLEQVRAKLQWAGREVDGLKVAYSSLANQLGNQMDAISGLANAVDQSMRRLSVGPGLANYLRPLLPHLHLR